MRTPEAARNRTNAWLLDAGTCEEAKELDSVSPCSASPLSAAAASPAGSSRLGYDSESEVLDLFTVDGHSALAASPAVARRERSRLHRASVADPDPAPIDPPSALAPVQDRPPAALGESEHAAAPSGDSLRESVEGDAAGGCGGGAAAPHGTRDSVVPSGAGAEPQRTGVTPVRLAWGTPECSPQKPDHPVGEEIPESEPSQAWEADGGLPLPDSLPQGANPLEDLLRETAQPWDDGWEEEPTEGRPTLDQSEVYTAETRTVRELPEGGAPPRQASRGHCDAWPEERDMGFRPPAEEGDPRSGLGVPGGALKRQLPAQLRRLPLADVPLGEYENMEPNSSERGGSPSSPGQRSAPLQVFLKPSLNPKAAH